MNIADLEVELRDIINDILVSSISEEDTDILIDKLIDLAKEKYEEGFRDGVGSTNIV